MRFLKYPSILNHLLNLTKRILKTIKPYKKTKPKIIKVLNRIDLHIYTKALYLLFVTI